MTQSYRKREQPAENCHTCRHRPEMNIPGGAFRCPVIDRNMWDGDNCGCINWQKRQEVIA